jgi:hypothetical protein
MTELEKEIQQAKFRNEYQKAFINTIYTANYLNLKNTCKLKGFGLTPEQYNVLRILRGQYPKPAKIQMHPAW